MPTLIHHLSEMPRLPLHVEGDVCRIVMDAPYSADSESTRTNAELRKTWIKEHCAGSAVPNIYWNPVIKQEVMDVRFSPEDLALYQRTFEQADGRSAVSGEHCLLMRHADYVADVRRLAHARWGTDQPALVKFPQLSYKLGEETQRASQKAHWQLLCRLRHISAQWTQSADLTADEIQALAQLNARLMQVEQWCVDEGGNHPPAERTQSHPTAVPNQLLSADRCMGGRWHLHSRKATQNTTTAATTFSGSLTARCTACSLTGHGAGTNHRKKTMKEATATAPKAATCLTNSANTWVWIGATCCALATFLSMSGTGEPVLAPHSAHPIAWRTPPSTPTCGATRPERRTCTAITYPVLPTRTDWTHWTKTSPFRAG
jgi:hypothetical protein